MTRRKKCWGQTLFILAWPIVWHQRRGLKFTTELTRWHAVRKGYEYSHVLKYRLVDLSPISRKSGFEYCWAKHKNMTKILILPKKFKNVRAVGWVSRLNVVKILNIGSHTHVELSGPSLELRTFFFENLIKTGKKSGESVWEITIPRYVFTTPYSCTSLQTTNNSLSFVEFWLVKSVSTVSYTHLTLPTNREV